METRLRLHDELLSNFGVSNVYFDPPSGHEMEYPCFVYKFEKLRILRANNRIYRLFRGYALTYITDDPDDDKTDEILNHFKHCSFDRPYVADDLYHFVFTLYY